VRGDRAIMCCPAELISTRVLSVNVFHHTTVLDRSFVVSRSLCSQADARSSGENPDVEYGFLESDVLEENNAEEEDGEEVASEPGLLDDDLSDSEKGLGGKDSDKEKDLGLCKAIMDAPSHSVASVLNKWAEEGNDLDQLRVSRIIINLRKRRMYGKALQVPILNISSNKSSLFSIFFLVNYFISTLVYTFYIFPPYVFKTAKCDTSFMGKYRINTSLVSVSPN
jgi:hypothetical protein